MVVLTTSTDARDQLLCELADASGIPWFRGSEEDKLERYRAAAAAFDVDAFAVVDGDDLFCSETHLDGGLDLLVESGADFVTQRGLPLGAASFCLSRSAVERVCLEKAERDTEVWGAYFTDSGRFECRYVDITDGPSHRPGVRMTLDYEEDLAFFTAVIDALFRPGQQPPPFEEIMAWLDDHPQIVALNAAAQARYESHLSRSPQPRFRVAHTSS